MSTLTGRRLLALVITLILAGLLDRLLSNSDRQMDHASFVSGYLLLFSVLVLASLHWRKRLSFLPLGPMTWWLQVHIYLGLLSCFVLGEHVGWRWPDGTLEMTLFGIFVCTAASGIVGLVLSRRLPARLTKLREQFLYEEIPSLRRQVSESARELVEGLVRQYPSSAIGDFYAKTLVSFFERPLPLRQFLWHTSRARNQLRNELATFKRYGNPTERTAQDELARLIDRRDDLDYHAVQQTRLRVWLFAHIGLTYPLLILAGLHAVLAHAFRGT